jgi:murein DD-endopeptidase MepM/ murein hydrolase activator NlpD
MCKRFVLTIFFLASILISFQPAYAQQASGPIYIVKSGDSLSSIASDFNIAVNDLISANNITNPNLLETGQQLTIPGLEGVSGVVDKARINIGDSYRSLMRRLEISENFFRKLNRIVSPSELYVGASIIIPQQQNTPQLTSISPSKGESLLELAVKQNTDVWTLADKNDLQGSWDGLPGDTLFTPGGEGTQTTSGLPSAFVSAKIRDLPLKQGGTSVITVQTIPEVSLEGVLVDHPLHFFPMADGTQVALQGVHAMLTPGVYPLRIDATLPDGTKQSFEQMVLVTSGYYPKDPVLTVDPTTIDPAVTEPENNQILAIVSAVTTPKLWQGVFSLPVATPGCIYSRFGDRRSFNGSDYIYFHAGVDYGICSETNPYDIYAPAPGVVVFDGPLIVRGNATIIDHGWGIFTGYWHQEKSYVTVGQQVQTGQLIGKIGATGRVTGPHLHWEVWANGVQVDPLDWLDQAYP